MAETTKATEKPEKSDKGAKAAKAEKGAKAATDAATAPGAAPAAGAPKGRKKKKNVPNGIVHIVATFNNTIITITDPQGNVVSWSSAGERGFKGSRKGTPFAAQMASEEACREAKDCGMRSVQVIVKGPGAGRESALRVVGQAGLKVMNIRDETPIPHNGCRPPKKRRV